jgi:hypothetical protein
LGSKVSVVVEVISSGAGRVAFGRLPWMGSQPDGVGTVMVEVSITSVARYEVVVSVTVVIAAAVTVVVYGYTVDGAT